MYWWKDEFGWERQSRDVSVGRSVVDDVLWSRAAFSGSGDWQLVSGWEKMDG